MRYRYIYKYKTGLTKVKTKLAIAFTAMGLGVGGVIGSVALFGAAHAAPPPFQLQPFEFVGAAGECGPAPGVDTVTAKWDNTTGAPSPSILLQKLGATSNCAAAGVNIISSSLAGAPVSSLTELNFDYLNGGHCGAGAPRFNIETDAGTAELLGCNTVVGTQTPATTTGWTHVEFSSSDIAASLATIPGATTIEGLSIIFDEGTDTGPDFTGTINIDNISVNNQVVGSPTSPTSQNDCKNNGWQNLLTLNGSSFKNQGACVSYAQHTNGTGQDDVHAKAVRQ